MSAASTPGPLDGKTILRFAHAFESGGGTERYLDDLDRSLLERNAVTIVRLHLTRISPTPAPSESPFGRGRLILIPLPIVPENRKTTSTDPAPSVKDRCREFVPDWVLYNPVVWRLFTAKWIQSLHLPAEPGQAVGAGKAAAEIIRTHEVDLAVMHFFGGADADEVIAVCRAARIPITLLNHYSNDRFLHLSIRKHALLSQGISGVNGLQLPGYVRTGFANLSDGIDTNHFRPGTARPLANAPQVPIILLAARVTREKGQLDLVKAVAHLRQSGVECCAALAGRVDSSGFVDELKQEIVRTGLVDHVLFLGSLEVDELRDWYGASTVVAFPTYHHEGLGRVIIEAQAMGVPVVAYATGGVPDAIESGRDGYLTATGDLVEFTARLKELLLSPEQRRAMGNRGRERANTQFSLTALAERHERHYIELMEGFRVDEQKPKPAAGDSRKS